jgi:hypothetical protein
MKRKTAPVSALVDEQLKKQFVRLAKKKRLTISEFVGQLMATAVSEDKQAVKIPAQTSSEPGTDLPPAIVPGNT